MDTSASGFLRAIPGFGSSASMPSDLSPRDKRMLAQVEKALASFDDLEEWADYIAFLARLRKSLSLPAENAHSALWLPLADQISAKLALCLSPVLPNGVHTKTLELYQNIFDALDVGVLNRDISIWLPGILPVVSFGSMQVKPQVIQLYKNTLFPHLAPATLKEITKPVLLSLVCGLDDENSEVFGDVMAVLDTFKDQLANNAHFWSTFFVCVICSPEKRLGALNWCVARLPVFASIDQSQTPKFSAEADACLSSEPGLLVRAFAAALNTRSSFNQANDIIVMRGFFDLLLSHIPLDSPVITHVISEADKELLIMACCHVTLKKDMSLNRRLWKWLLGPESGEDASKRDDTRDYFSKHAFPVIEKGLQLLISSGNTKKTLDAYNISLAMIMDRWEISELITGSTFVPIVESVFQSVESGDAKGPELLSASKRLFDQVEAYHIWHYMTHTLILGSSAEASLPMICFLLKNYNFPEDDTHGHASMAILAFLLSHEPTKLTIPALELLSELVQPKRFQAGSKVSSGAEFTREHLLQILSSHYSIFSAENKEQPPFSASDLSFLVVKHLEEWYIKSMSLGSFSDRMATLLCEFLDSFQTEEDLQSFDQGRLKQSLLEHPEIESGQANEAGCSSPIIFGMVKLYRFVSRTMSFAEKSRMLKIMLSNLWATLTSVLPANYQVEAVRCIFDLRIHFDTHEIEAGISYMLLNTPEKARLQSFYKLWSLSQDINESEVLLSNPLFIVLDSLHDQKSGGSIDAQKFIHNICTDGSANKFLKIVTGPLLGFSFVQQSKTSIDIMDDFKLFAYHLEVIISIVRSNEKSLKEILAHEFVPSENTERFELFTSNGWDVSNYKSLLLSIIQKSLKLKVSDNAKATSHVLAEFTNCIAKILELYSLLITGSEPDFGAQFKLLTDACSYFVIESGVNDGELDHVELLFIKHIRAFLGIANSMSINVTHLSKNEQTGSSEFVAFINQGIQKCSSPSVLEKWLALMKSTLYLLDNSIYGEMLLFNQTIIEKVGVCFTSLSKFECLENCSDAESFLTICLTGLEDLLSISHSYLVTPAPGLTARSQQAENGFFGNVISGVFQIESPLVKSEEEQRVYAVTVAFQDAIRIAFLIWSWADGKPAVQDTNLQFCSQKSMTHMSNKVKFRAKKFLESLSELERQETIETILETNQSTETKIKLLHVLDSGHSQISLPNILNSVLTRCSPQTLTDKQKSSMYSGITERRLCQSLIPYYASIDADTIDEIWEMSLAFFKEVSLHPMNFKMSLLTILQMMKVVSGKSQARISSEGKRSFKEFTNYFLAILNASVNKKSFSSPPDKQASIEGIIDGEGDQVSELVSIVETLGEIIHEQDKISTAVNTIVNTVVLSQAKPKATSVPPQITSLMLSIGKNYPIRAWKQVVLDTFVDNSFFQNGKYAVDQWRAIIQTWISTDKERMGELVGKITPPSQSSAANIFIWNDHSEVEDRAMVLRRISYLILVSPKDFFVKNLNDIIDRLATALDSTCPVLYKSEALMVFRALSLKFSEGHLLPYWSFIVQCLVGVFSAALAKNSKQFSGMDQDELSLVLSASKLLDQLLLVQFDEVNLMSWLFVSRGSVASEDKSTSLIDRLALKSESLLSKQDPVNVEAPRENERAKPLLYGVSEVKNIANLKKFFGSLGYINFERSYGLAEPDLDSCETDLLLDLGKQWK